MEKSFIRKNIYGGFTMVELAVTMSIAAIILTLAIPSLSSTLQNNRMRLKLKNFSNALEYARSTALAQKNNVLVCPFVSLNQTNCGNNTNWSTGWVVIGQSSTGTTTLLQSHQSASSDPVLASMAPPGGGVASNITYTPKGLASWSRFRLCDARGSGSARALEVLSNGATQVGATPGKAVWGGALVCP